MKFPSRKPREIAKHLEHVTCIMDHEDVVQDDGSIAKFYWMSGEKEKGWQFDYYKDENGFKIWTEKDQTSEYAELLLKSTKDKIDSTFSKHIDDVKLKDDEEIKYYAYGGFLSGRGGFYIINKNEPNKILKSLAVWMS
jgi:hypothetical protein